MAEATNSTPGSTLGVQVDQTVSGEGNQAIGQMAGGTAISHMEGREIQIGNRIYQADPETVKRIVREELRLAHSEYGEPVGIGLQALADLMQAPVVRDGVVTFRVVFEATCQQIALIADYKALHDLLHTLEFQCYNGIVQESRRFPGDDTALEILMDHQLTLQGLLGEIQQVAARGTLPKAELSWVEDVQKAGLALEESLISLDPRVLQRGLWLLNRVLAIQPSRINTNLTRSARSLRLPDLVGALSLIVEKLVGISLDTEKQQQFYQGVVVLADLNYRLEALLISHDYWQEFDLELRRIEASLDQDLMEVELSWPDFQERLAILFDGQTDPWIKAFQQDSQALEKALQDQNPVKIKLYFRQFRRRAGERFYQVDVTLKRLCEELREVGGPLASVLRMMT